jgi:Uncharacterized protein conserved in bacteria
MVTLTALLASACSSGAAEEEGRPVVSDSGFTDFASLVPPDSPNAWVVAPAGVIRGKADEDAPTFAVDAARLAAAWRQVVAAEPRTTITGVSADGLQIEAEQRSALFGFVDDISFRAIPLADGGSTLAVYSRSRVGYWDLGVNRGRVRSWLGRLGHAVARGSLSEP